MSVDLLSAVLYYVNRIAMLKRILTITILLATLAVIGQPLYSPVYYTGRVAQAQSGPDLIVESIASSPETPAIGDEVTFTVTVKNQGTAASDQFFVGYYIDGNYLTRDSLDSIGTGASTEQTFTWTAEAGIYTISAVADYREQVTESNEGNNQKAYTLSVLGADLIIDSITWSPSAPTVGSTVTFTLTVRNQGAVAAKSNRVDFYIDGVSRGNKDVERIDAGGTANQTFTWFAQAGDHDIKGTIDTTDNVPETDEDNNETTVLFTPLLPDLYVEEIAWSPEAPSLSDNVSFSANITNQGSGVSGNSSIHFYVDGVYLDTELTSKLEAGASENITFNWIAKKGIHEIKVIIGVGGFITESDETNNEKTVVFSPHLADLIVESITWSPTDPVIGDDVTFKMIIRNQGSGGSADSRVDLLVDEVFTEYKGLGEMTANTTAEVNFVWRVRAGQHRIRGIVDPREVVLENNDLNNVTTVTFVPNPPDLIVEQITWSPSNPSIGDTVTFTVAVKNQGQANADHSDIVYYIDNFEISTDRVNPISINATDNQTFTWTATAGEHAIKAIADFTKKITESDEANNELVTTMSSRGPDLIIENIEWSHNDPPVGETVTFTLTIKNEGGSRSGTSLVHLYIDDNPGGFQEVPELTAGATIARTFSWKVAAGPHFIRTVVDDSNQVPESNEANNERLIGYPMPDLTFEIVTWTPVSPAMGDQVTVNAYVKNAGSRRSEAFQLYFYTDDKVLSQQEVMQLDADTRVIKTFEWDVAAGPHVLAVLADGADAIAEGDESNNRETIDIFIPAPDLIIESITWPSGEPSASDNVAFTVTIKNQGDSRSGYASLDYYLDGEYLASGGVDSIEPDESTEETFSTWISQVGQHTVKVIIDEVNQVPEGNEINNEKTVIFSTENVTPPSEQVLAPTQPQPMPLPAPIPTPEKETDYKVPILFGITAVVFSATLLLALLRELRKRR
jgi:subtilase family serine protease